MTGMFWTDERVSALKRLHEGGKTYTEIANALGCTRGSIGGKIDRLGLQKRPHRERVVESNKRRARAAKPKAAKPVLSQPEAKRPGSLWAAYLAEIGPEPVSFAELRERHCRWILNDDMRNPEFCGQGRDGSSYCAAHRLLAYGAG